MNNQEFEQFFARMQEYAALRPYTLEMPHNPAPAKYMENRLKESGMRPLFSSGDFRFVDDQYVTLVGQKGKGTGKTIAFVFHYDIAPDEATWHIEEKHTLERKSVAEFSDFLDPAHIAIAGEEIIVGKGVADMLGAAEAMLSLIASVPDDFPGSVIIIATPDEERGSLYGMIPVLKKMAEEKKVPDVIIGAESTFMDVLVRRRGGYAFDVVLQKETQQFFTHHYVIKTTGVNMHPGIFTIEKRDQHANFLMARALSALPEYQLRHMRGGHIVNVIPNQCVAHISTKEPITPDQMHHLQDYLSIEKVSVEESEGSVIIGMENALEAIAHFSPTVEAQSDYGISIGPNYIVDETISISARVMQGNKELFEEEIRTILQEYSVMPVDLFFHYVIAPFFSDTNHPLLPIAVQALQQAGFSPTGNRENYGSSDLNFLYPYKEVWGCEIGPIGANEHGADEWVSVDSLRALPGVYKNIIDSFFDL